MWMLPRDAWGGHEHRAVVGRFGLITELNRWAGVRIGRARRSSSQLGLLSIMDGRRCQGTLGIPIEIVRPRESRLRSRLHREREDNCPR